MASTASPPPNSSPAAVPPTSSTSSPSSPSPTKSQPNQTTVTPSNPSAPPPQTPSPSTPAALSPSPPLSPPPTTPSSPPPAPASRPPTPPTSPANAPPPAAISSPPPPNASPPPPVNSSPPPQSSQATPVASPSPPPPQAVSPSPPPPGNASTPPSTNSPPPPAVKPPKSSPGPPKATPPPHGSQSSSPPPATNSPPPPITALPSPPPSVPSTSSPAPVGSPPSPPDNSKRSGSPTMPVLPPIPTEKPTARSTNGTSGSGNTTSSNAGGLNTGGAAAIAIVAGFVVLSLLVIAVWFVIRQKRRRAGSNVGYNVPSPFTSAQNSESLFLKPQSPAPLGGSLSGGDFIYSPSETGGVNNSRSWFTYGELVQATNGFSTHNLLGEGGFGCVYKGVLVDGRDVAVKQLKIGGAQGEREFKAEVEIISRVHHRHLVSLVGYCISEHQRLLVYDYVPNNTLHFHLHEGRPVMDWTTRVKVAAGAARGIAYLHEDCHPRIIHRDIKSSNILLDSNFEARVSDFGLAKLALDSNTHVTTRVMGTFGYMAPEYATSGKLTEKSDVFSFGVVLLELITGRKPVDASQPLGDESLVEWARPLLTEALDNENFEALVDPGLENYVASEMFRMIEAAAACVRHSAAKRPRMSQVVRALDSLDELSDLSNGMKPGQSEIFDSRQHSAQIRMFQRLAFGGSHEYSSDFFNPSQSSWSSREHGDRSTVNQ